ncbi:MAG: nucleotidyltransferase domain-containing protein [Cyclobacteriaceae bacterium]
MINILSQLSHIERAILYGSRAKGDFKTGSDIDLTLVGSQLDHHDLITATRLFSESTLPYIIDLSLKENIENQELLDHIDRVGTIIFQTEEASTVMSHK